MRLSVVIVNYNVKYYVEQCLTALFRALEDIESEVFVVDNNSSDGSVEYLERRFPGVLFIANKENVGFSRANNQAIIPSKGEYILLLNPDTIVNEELIKDFLHLVNDKPQIGGVGVRMYGADGCFAFESRRGFPSPMTSFYKLSGLSSLFPYSRRFGKYHMRYLKEDEVNKIEVISGACMFLRKEALDKSGLLDETFFMYGEDIDLSYRVTLAGYENYYLPSSIIHYKGESTKKDSFRYVYTFYDAMIIFFKKHYPSYGLLFSFFVKLFIWMRAIPAIITRFIRKIGSSLGIKKKIKHPCFCVLGDEKTIRDIKYICDRNHLINKHHYIMANENTSPQGPMTLAAFDEKFTHIVFDNAAYSYSKMIEILAAIGCKRKIELGTYSKESKVLITSTNVYK